MREFGSPSKVFSVFLWLILTPVVLRCFVPEQPVSSLSPELSDLVVYTRSVPFRDFRQAARKPATDMSSFSESDALRHVKETGRRRLR